MVIHGGNRVPIIIFCGLSVVCTHTHWYREGILLYICTVLISHCLSHYSVVLFVNHTEIYILYMYAYWTMVCLRISVVVVDIPI